MGDASRCRRHGRLGPGRRLWLSQATAFERFAPGAPLCRKLPTKKRLAAQDCSAAKKCLAAQECSVAKQCPAAQELAPATQRGTVLCARPWIASRAALALFGARRWLPRTAGSATRCRRAWRERCGRREERARAAEARQRHGWFGAWDAGRGGVLDRRERARRSRGQR
jgi:hypothetical protein